MKDAQTANAVRAEAAPSDVLPTPAPTPFIGNCNAVKVDGSDAAQSGQRDPGQFNTPAQPPVRGETEQGS
jgi:hypothetical protein